MVPVVPMPVPVPLLVVRILAIADFDTHSQNVWRLSQTIFDNGDGRHHCHHLSQHHEIIVSESSIIDPRCHWKNA